MIKSIMTLGCVAALTHSAPALATTFSDQVFAPGSYALNTYAMPGVVTTLGQSRLGNPGFGLRGTYAAPGANPNGELFTAINTSFVYDPSVSGAITTLGASLDRYYDLNILGQPGNVLAYTLRLLAVQDGKTYQAIFSTPSSGPGGYWLNLARSGILASDFRLFDPADYGGSGGATGLDFAGGAITFGFAMRATGLSDGNGDPINDASTGDLRADNFVLRINDVAAVPEPATWGMMVLGFGAVGGGMRRWRARRSVAPAGGRHQVAV